jgi:predicted O-linked N-acetylglucosamine transferase (SPINDLY family)
MVPPPPSRTQAGLPPDAFVFCCFNNSWKIAAPVFEIWMRLLQQVPFSVLWLLDSAASSNLRAQAQARGVDPARLLFAPKIEPDAHLARHQLADLFLDTLPYNAHTTCSDALWAGLPVVTCYGKTFHGRVAASLLKAIDMTELVTMGPSDYETVALDLAKNPALLKATREKLARNRTTTALYDSEAFRKGIEAAYEAMLT